MQDDNFPLDIVELDDLLNKAGEAVESEEYHTATGLLRKILRINPSEYRAYNFLSVVAYKNNNYTKSLEYLCNA